MIYATPQNVLHNKIHKLSSYKFIIPVVLVKCMFQNLEQYKGFQSANVCKTESVYSDLLSELVLFQFDTVLDAVAYMFVQKLGIELSNSYSHQYQKLLISYHNINTTVL